MNFIVKTTMKLILASAMLSGCAMTKEIAVQPTAKTSYDLPHVKRSNLLVADLDRSLTIYRDILGLTASEPSVSGPDSYSYPVFNIPKGTQMRSMTLHEPGEQRVMALTELKGIVLPKPVSAPYMSTVVIGINDLESSFEEIKAMGLTVTEPKIADGVDFDFIEQAFVDFDGHLIVCYQILPI